MANMHIKYGSFIAGLRHVFDLQESWCQTKYSSQLGSHWDTEKIGSLRADTTSNDYSI